MGRSSWLLIGALVLTLTGCQSLSPSGAGTAGSGSAPVSATAGGSALVSATPSASSGSPVTGAADSLIVEPSAGYSPIYQAIEGATSSIDLVMYELEDEEAESLLVAARDRGVAVRVILDQAEAMSQNQAADSYLSAHGVAVHWSPTTVDITHQKTLVVDDRTAWIMTGNLTPQYYSSTRDFTVVDGDAADVAAIVRTFDADFDGTPITPSGGDDLVWSPGSTGALTGLIDGATSSLLVENEEMSDPSIVEALEAAARRGVDVEVCMTDSSSWESEFSELAQAGVHLRTYAASASLYIHAKVIVADPGLATQALFVGSENFSETSLTENRELGLILRNPALIAEITAVLEQDLSGAVPTT